MGHHTWYDCGSTPRELMGPVGLLAKSHAIMQSMGIQAKDYKNPILTLAHMDMKRHKAKVL